jgi:hypothetical protein
MRVPFKIFLLVVLFFCVGCSIDMGDMNFGNIFGPNYDPPDPPKLYTPRNGAIIANRSLSLSFGLMGDVFLMQVARDKGFKNIFFEFSGTTERSVKIEGLERSRTYFWRAKAQNSNGWSNWSNTWCFYIL